MNVSKKSFKLSKKTIISMFLCVPLSLVAAVWLIFDTSFAPIVPFEQKNAVETSNKDTKAKVEIKKEITIKSAPTVIKPTFSTTDPASIWTVVNKSHHLNPIAYSPADLVTTHGATISAKAQKDFEAMIASALAEGVSLPIVSSYRSYYTQQALYSNYVATYGQAATDTFSARAGYSEHQTGLAIDFGSNTVTTCNLDSCFGQTAEGRWLAANAYRFGFLLRYTAAKQGITGYKDEPWHYRYIGRDLALNMNKMSIATLEEYFKVSGGTRYI